MTQEKEKDVNGDHSDGMGSLEDSTGSFDSDDETTKMEEVISEENVSMEEALESEQNNSEIKAKAYLPKYGLQDGEELEYDTSAYDMYFMLNSEWPCLSFDFLRDSLGTNRRNYPMTAYAVAGTQADSSNSNKIVIMKMSKMCKTKHDDGSDDENEDEESDMDDDTIDEDPVLEHKYISYYSAVNRLRVMPNAPKGTHIVGVWNESGRVDIFNITKAVRVLDGLNSTHTGEEQDSVDPEKPIFSYTGHGGEGFAIDWSPTVAGRLLTGDCRSRIFLWQPSESGWQVGKSPFQGHTESVEDLQWSPVETELFASASVDRTIRLWDARRSQSSAAVVQAHEADVNVISWNRTSPHLIASGCDDGSFKIWDIRQFKSPVCSPAASFTWHTSPITSIEWHPTDECVLAVSDEKDQVTLWDLSLEKDSEDKLNDVEDDTEVPPQLLFVHQGQQMVKEVHWHPQIPGVLMSTAFTGFNIFKTISV